MNAAAELIGLALLVLTVLAAVPAAVFCAEVFAGIFRRDAVDPGDAGLQVPRTDPLVVLMPAHDEAAGIAVVIAAVLRQLGPGDRLLVVADNCSDATASIARAAGAEVCERTDPERRGKGYALDHGVRWLQAGPPGLGDVLAPACTVAPPPPGGGAGGRGFGRAALLAPSQPGSGRASLGTMPLWPMASAGPGGARLSPELFRGRGLVPLGRPPVAHRGAMGAGRHDPA